MENVFKVGDRVLFKNKFCTYITAIKEVKDDYVMTLDHKIFSPNGVLKYADPSHNGSITKLSKEEIKALDNIMKEEAQYEVDA